MKSMLALLAVLFVFCCCNAHPAFAEKVSVKIGYFNEALVKSKYSPSVEADQFRIQAEQNLRDEVTAGNKRLADAQANGTSADELKRMAKDLQVQIDTRQKELIAQYQARRDGGTQAVNAAIAAVANRLGLDVVVDGAMVYSGGALCVANGYDITDPVLAALNVSGASTSPKGTLKSLPVQWGYFDRAAIVKVLPDLDVDAVKTNAEKVLLREVEEGNQRLLTAKTQGKSRAELEKMAADLQQEINSKQKGFIQLVKDQQKDVNTKLISKLSQGEGATCDITVDDTGIRYGAQLVSGKGASLTQLVCGGPSRPSPGTSQPATTAMVPPSATTAAAASAYSTAPSTSSTSSSTTSATITDTPIRDKWAVVVGISKFAEPRYNLKFAAKDALDFRNFLVNEQQFKPDHIVTLLDEQATRANIMSAFGSKWLPTVAEPGDLVVIYLSTHGTPSSIDNGGRNYVVAYDTDANNLYATAVDMDELSRRIKEGVRSDRALIVLDTCFSGNSISGSKSLNRSGNFDLKEFAVGNGHLIISSSSSNQASWESKHQQNGIFTHYLIETLRASKGNVKSAFPELQEKVQWEVKRDYGSLQEPQLGGNWQGKELVLSAPASRPRPMTGVAGEKFILPTALQPKAPSANKPVAH